MLSYRYFDLEHVLNLVLVFFYLTLNMQMPVFFIMWYNSLKFAIILRIHNSNPLGIGRELSVYSNAVDAINVFCMFYMLFCLRSVPREIALFTKAISYEKCQSCQSLKSVITFIEII